MIGYVYLIGSPTFGWYKIGKSKTPDVRVTHLGILLPFKIEVLALWKAADHHAMEKALHEMYEHLRINGEWFQFKRKEVFELINAIPAQSLISEKLDKFSNIVEDRADDRRVIGLRREKLRGNFTPEERLARKNAATVEGQMRRAMRDTQLELFAK